MRFCQTTLSPFPGAEDAGFLTGFGFSSSSCFRNRLNILYVDFPLVTARPRSTPPMSLSCAVGGSPPLITKTPSRLWPGVNFRYAPGYVRRMTSTLYITTYCKTCQALQSRLHNPHGTLVMSSVSRGATRGAVSSAVVFGVCVAVFAAGFILPIWVRKRITRL